MFEKETHVGMSLTVSRSEDFYERDKTSIIYLFYSIWIVTFVTSKNQNGPEKNKTLDKTEKKKKIALSNKTKQKRRS